MNRGPGNAKYHREFDRWLELPSPNKQIWNGVQPQRLSCEHSIKRQISLTLEALVLLWPSFWYIMARFLDSRSGGRYGLLLNISIIYDPHQGTFSTSMLKIRPSFASLGLLGLIFPLTPMRYSFQLNGLYFKRTSFLRVSMGLLPHT